MNAFILLKWYWCSTKKTSLDETYSFWNVEFRAPRTLSQMSYLANRTIEKVKFLHIAFLIVGIVLVCLYWHNLFFFSIPGTREIVFSRLPNPTGFSVTSKLCGLLTKIPKIDSVYSNSWFTRKYRRGLF